MSTTTVHTEQANDQTEARTRRGLQLYRERAGEIMHSAGSYYLVPATTREPAYLVDTDAECCTCPDYQKRSCQARTPKTGDQAEPCKHVYAATIVRARDRAAARRRQAGKDAERMVFTPEQIEENLERMGA